MNNTDNMSKLIIAAGLKPDYVVTASKVGDGIVNFRDNYTKSIIQKRIQWEEKCMIESCSDSTLFKLVGILIKEIRRRGI